MGDVQLDREETSLLLYLETCAVDHGGRVDARHMNAEDMVRAKTMQERDGLLRFGRILSAEIQRVHLSHHPFKGTHWVELTDAGWSAAHAARKARGIRSLMDKGLRTESKGEVR
jgi:hypothetical protein